MYRHALSLVRLDPNAYGAAHAMPRWGRASGRGTNAMRTV
jgi:hypothetical protein